MQSRLARRRIKLYEERSAAYDYAYGVDLRRAQWWLGSSVGNQVMRMLDRAWPQLLEQLRDEIFLPANTLPARVARAVHTLAERLRAPLPTVAVLRPQARDLWPVVSVLGPTRADAAWMILDIERLETFEPDERAFALGSALGHVQCGHGAYFAVQWLMQARTDQRTWLSFARRLLSPWRGVMTFSADRAGLAACLELSTAYCALARLESLHAKVPWLGQQPPLAWREQALAEFAQTAVMRRFAALAAKENDPQVIGKTSWLHTSLPTADTASAVEVGGISSASSTRATVIDDRVDDDDEHDWSLARCDARLTARLGLY